MLALPYTIFRTLEQILEHLHIICQALRSSRLGPVESDRLRCYTLGSVPHHHRFSNRLLSGQFLILSECRLFLACSGGPPPPAVALRTLATGLRPSPAEIFLEPVDSDLSVGQPRRPPPPPPLPVAPLSPPEPATWPGAPSTSRSAASLRSSRIVAVRWDS